MLPLATLFAMGSAGAQAAEALRDVLGRAHCPASQDLNLPYQFDYRNRDSIVPSPIGTSPQWNFRDNWQIHTGPAIERLQKGELTRQVIADLDFTFKRWPNHLQALNALVAYYTGGGKQFEFLPAECYLQRAISFAPNDPGVWQTVGIYFYRLDRLELAREALERALELSPGSVEAHYNLGLVFVKLKDLPKATEHADAAYAGGYPLPGLRRQVQEMAGR